MRRLFLLGLTAVLGGSTLLGRSAPPPPVSFSRQILPLFQSDCTACHGGNTPTSGFSMTTRDLLIKGGRHGAGMVVGKGAQSSLVRYLTGANKPQMPPGIAWDMERVNLVKRWIDEGAKVDSYTPVLSLTKKGSTTRLPESTKVVHTLLSAPVTSLAYSPDGSRLAVAGFRSVRLLDPKTGNVERTLTGAANQVQALAWSSDGKQLAVGGGEPGVSGEIALFDTHQGTLLRKLIGHTEVVTTVDWRPNAPEIATGSLDKTIRLWNIDSGACTRTSKDHADIISCVTYSSDGTLLASASADRTAKVFDTSTWKRLYTLNAHPEPLTHVAFHPNGKLLATASMDKTVRLWTLKSGGMENPDRTLYEGDTINACRFSTKGDFFVYGAANRKVKLYNGDGTQQKRDQQEAEDWVYSVAIAPDSQTFVAGTQDGKLLFWSTNEGKLLRTIAFSPPSPKKGATK